VSRASQKLVALRCREEVAGDDDDEEVCGLLKNEVVD